MSYYLNNSSGRAGLPTESPAKEISELLKTAVEQAGEYTFGGVASDLPSILGLAVEGFGPVTTPLVDPALLERLAAHGRGIKTVADPAERCVAWQFGASQVTIANKAWDHGFAQLMATVATRLGCPKVPLRADLAKLSLFGPGAFVSPTQDGEKEDRMFAKLIIQLPSAHKGGELVVYQPDGSAVTHDFGAAEGTGAFAPHYALHYADAEYELKPITSGYRLALVYSICWPEGHKQIDLLQALPAQRQLATHLSTLGNDQRSFFLTLAHKYEPTSVGRLRVKALTGRDLARSNMIRAANAMLADSSAFTLYLVHATRDVQDGPDIMDFWQLFPLWVDIDTGKQYELTQKNFNLGTMINPDGKSDKDLSSVEKKCISKEYMVDGCQTHYRYGCYLLVGIPKSLGPHGLLPYIGTAAIDQLIDIHSCSAADFSLLLSSLPDSAKQPAPVGSNLLLEGRDSDFYTHPHLLPTTKTDFSAKLLETMVSRSLVDCIPTFYATMPDPLSAAMIPAYMQAMATPSLWVEIQPHLLAHLHKAQEPFMLGLKLVCDAVLLANIPVDHLADLIAALGPLPAPSHMLTSMPAVLTRAATIPRIWHAVHTTVVTFLRAAADENKTYGQSGYDQVSARELVFRLALSIAVRAANAGVPDAHVGELLTVLAHCNVGSPLAASPAPVYPTATYEESGYLEALGPLLMDVGGSYGRGSSSGAPCQIKLARLIAASMPDFKLATHSPAVWAAVMPLLCDWLARPGVKMNRFGFAVQLAVELVDHHAAASPALDLSPLWQPLMDASMSTADFLSHTFHQPAFGLTHRPNQTDCFTLADLIVHCMRREQVWAYTSARISRAISDHFDRFGVGIRVLETAQKDASIPVDRWVPLVPVVFASIPSESGISRSAGHDRVAFWSVVVAGDAGDGGLIDELVRVHVEAKYPAGLQTTVTAVVTLLARGLVPAAHAHRFVPLLELRRAYLDSVMPPAGQPVPTPWAIATASVPASPLVERFLRSNQEKLVIQGFARRREAKTWVRELGNLYFEERDVFVSVDEKAGREWDVELRKAAPKGYRWMETDDKKLAEMREEVARINEAVRLAREGPVSDAMEE